MVVSFVVLLSINVADVRPGRADKRKQGTHAQVRTADFEYAAIFQYSGPFSQDRIHLCMGEMLDYVAGVHVVHGIVLEGQVSAIGNDVYLIGVPDIYGDRIVEDLPITAAYFTYDLHSPPDPNRSPKYFGQLISDDSLTNLFLQLAESSGK